MNQQSVTKNYSENSRFWISPWSGWEQEFSSYEEAIATAREYIKKDFEFLRTKHGYKKPEHLVDVRNS